MILERAWVVKWVYASAHITLVLIKFFFANSGLFAQCLLVQFNLYFAFYFICKMCRIVIFEAIVLVSHTNMYSHPCVCFFVAEQTS